MQPDELCSPGFFIQKFFKFLLTTNYFTPKIQTKLLNSISELKTK